jgi:hypothetical protein
MPKLDVGVGDEFPAKEVKDEPRREEGGPDGPHVHHHHYYRRRYPYYRYRGRWLWFVLWILAVTAVFRMFDMMTGAAGWAWSWWGGSWGPWGPWMMGPFHALRGTLMAILIIGGLLFLIRWRAREEERDIEGERDEDRR